MRDALLGFVVLAQEAQEEDSGNDLIKVKHRWPRKKPFYRFLIRRADLVFVNSRFVADLAREVLVLKRDPVIIGCGITPEHLAPAMDRSEARRQLAGRLRLMNAARRWRGRAGHAGIARRLGHRFVDRVGVGADEQVGHRDQRDLVDRRQRLQAARLQGPHEVAVGRIARLADEVVDPQRGQSIGAAGQPVRKLVYVPGKLVNVVV